jgi:hypothetical protein
MALTDFWLLLMVGHGTSSAEHFADKQSCQVARAYHNLQDVTLGIPETFAECFPMKGP